MPHTQQPFFWWLSSEHANQHLCYHAQQVFHGYHHLARQARCQYGPVQHQQACKSEALRLARRVPSKMHCCLLVGQVSVAAAVVLPCRISAGVAPKDHGELPEDLSMQLLFHTQENLPCLFWDTHGGWGLELCNDASHAKPFPYLLELDSSGLPPLLLLCCHWGASTKRSVVSYEAMVGWFVPW